MLELQQTISFSDYSSLYDLIIPKDNLLRRITDLVDFSFVYQELQDKYCHDNGRTAESPIRMFKYLLLKVIYNISDVDVVERTRYDMSFKQGGRIKMRSPPKVLTGNFRPSQLSFFLS